MSPKGWPHDEHQQPQPKWPAQKEGAPIAPSNCHLPSFIGGLAHMNKEAKSKGFFALDVNQFEKLSESGLGVEEAATYLSLLKSTNQSNVISIGGVQSVVNYSGLTKSEAKRAIINLEGTGLLESLEVERKRARRAERYKLPIFESRKPLSAKERSVLNAIKAGDQPSGKSDVQAAHRASAKGWAEKLSNGWHVVENTNTVAFIPNSFVQPTEGRSPLHRLVTNGELGPIMLAAKLYLLQNLMDERGVPLNVIRGFFHASDEHRRRFQNHNLHYLMPGRKCEDQRTGKPESFSLACNHHRLGNSGGSLWDNLTALDRAHVIEWSVYSANGKPSEGDKFAYTRPQRPLGVLRNGRQVLNTPESRPAFMAFLVYKLKQAGGEITQSLPQLIEEWKNSGWIFAFENASISHVEGVSILRLTHRASTDNARVWYRDLCHECNEAFFFIESAAQSYFPQLSGIIEEIQKTPNFKGAISM